MDIRTTHFSNLLLLGSILVYADALPVVPIPPTEACDCATDRPSQQFFEYLQRHPQSMPIWHRTPDDLRVRQSRQDAKHMWVSSHSATRVDEDHRAVLSPVKSPETMPPTQVLMGDLQDYLAGETATASPSAPTTTAMPPLLHKTVSGVSNVGNEHFDMSEITGSQGLGCWFWLGLTPVAIVALFALAMLIVEVVGSVRRKLCREENPRRGRLRLRGRERFLQAYKRNEKEVLHQ